MNREQKDKLQREALLQAAAALQAMRDTLLSCSDLLREHQFDTDEARRQVAIDHADALFKKLGAVPPAKRSG